MHGGTQPKIERVAIGVSLLIGLPTMHPCL
jgi:hypothetical protein